MELAAGLLLIVAMGFFSGSETALYRANWIRLTNWVERNLSGAALALRCLERRETGVIATLVGTNLSVVFATELCSRFFEHRFGATFAPVAVILVVILTLIIGEYLPKALASAYPDRWLRRAALPVAVSRWAFAPAVYLLAGIARLFSAPVTVPGRRFTLTRSDFLAVINQRDRDRTGIAPARLTGRLVSRLFRFSGMKVGEVEIPIEEVKSVPRDAGMNEIMTVAGTWGFSRLPVFDGAPENITGVIVVKDLLSAPVHRVRRITRVPAGARAMEVLRGMQRRGEHLAVVEDETGRTSGIVSLEDLLEELVGEIRSED
jgi:CBS domain containing-hemolysin-like protein